MGRNNIWDYVNEAKNTSSIDAAGIKDLLYSVMTPDATGVEIEHIDSVIENVVTDLIEAGYKSDKVDKALTNMKAVFGNKVGAAIYEAFSFGSVDPIEAWQDTLSGLEFNIQEQLGREDLISDGWAKSLTEELEAANHSQEDIITSYEKFLKYYEQGLIDDQWIQNLLTAEDVAKTYEEKMGQLNKVSESIDETASALSEVEETWDEYMANAAKGGQDYVDDLMDIQAEM